jgi:hypothetical protein
MEAEPRRSIRPAAGAMALWVAAVVPCLAAPPTNLAPEGDLVDRIEREEQDAEVRFVGVGGVRLSVPQQLSGAIGGMRARLPTSYDCSEACEYRGWLLEAEPGLAGGQISGGYAVVVGEQDSGSRFLSDVFLAYGVRAAILRTWGDADLDPPDQTLAGLEGQFTIIRIHFDLGLFRSLESGPVEDRWLVTGGVGWGF